MDKLHWVFIALCGLYLVEASGGYTLVGVFSLVPEHRLSGLQASVVAAHGLSSCGTGA